MDNQNGINLEERYIVMSIPKDTVEVEITAKVWHNKEVLSVSKTMDFDEVRAMFEEAEHGYFPEDAIFTLTGLGKEMMEKMKAEQIARMESEE